MKPIALIGAGAVARSPIAPFLRGRLGLVKGASYRLAGRLVGALRCGSAVKEYEDLAGAAAILICVHDHSVPDIVRELAASALHLEGLPVILCDSRRDSGELRVLRDSGACAATINEVHDFFVTEGDRPAVRFIRRLLQPHRVRPVELSPGSKNFFFAGLAFSGELFTPLACAALTSFQRSGLERPQAAKIMETVFERSLRSFITAGKKGWSLPPPAELLDPLLNEYRKRLTDCAHLLMPSP
jgi:hypothetical protein